MLTRKLPLMVLDNPRAMLQGSAPKGRQLYCLGSFQVLPSHSLKRQNALVCLNTASTPRARFTNKHGC